MKIQHIIFRIIFYTMVVVFLFVFFKPLVWRYHCTPWAAYRARHRIHQVHPGMTDTQVWETLGLSAYRFRAHVSGSGDPHGYPANYFLWPGDILYCRWNLTSNPPVVIEARFKNGLHDR
jgi:hypothetical protein